MRAESGFRDDGDIVPHGTNPSVVAAVAGCAVRVHALSLEVARGWSVASLGEICEKLFRAQSRLSLGFQFCIGDAYLSTRSYSKERKGLEEIIERVMGKSYAVRMRHFGSIARRWPADRRSDNLVWEYYKTHRPGEPGKPDVPIVKKPIPLVEVSREVVGSVETVRYKGRDEQLYVAVRAVKP